MAQLCGKDGVACCCWWSICMHQLCGSALGAAGACACCMCREVKVEYEMVVLVM